MLVASSSTVTPPCVRSALGKRIVPVNFANLRHPKRDMIWVAAAGPGSNFAQALAWTIVLAAAAGSGMLSSDGLARMAYAGVQINLVLMALNPLPIPPLDGGRIVSGLLPTRMSIAYSRIEPYGLIILLVLMFTGALSFFLRPLLNIGGAIVQLFA